MPTLYNQQQAANYLLLSERTLERMRVTGTGPRYSKIGRRVVYRECDLIEWVNAGLRQSTSEAVEARQ